MGADFPNIQKPSSRQRVVSKPQLKSDFEAGYSQVRPKGTRAKHSWTLTWNLLSIDDWKLLHDHFVSASGSEFYVSKDIIFEDTDKLVIYSVDEITAKSTNTKGRYSVEIKIEEV